MNINIMEINIFYPLFFLVIFSVLVLKMLSKKENYNDIYIVSANYCFNDQCVDPNIVRATFQYYANIGNSISITNETFGTDPSPGNSKSSTVNYYNNGIFTTQTKFEGQILTF